MVEPDCLNVVQRVNEKHQDRFPMEHLVIQIRNSPPVPPPNPIMICTS